MSLAADIVVRLNEQIERENNASNHYLAMASWCEHRGYTGSAYYLYTAADEEREHMLNIFKYINANGGHALVPSNRIPHRDTYDSLISVFEKVHEMEVTITGQINEVVAYCLTKQDFATFDFMMGYVREQQGAIQETQYIIDLFNVMGGEGPRLYFLDKEIRKITDRKLAPKSIMPQGK